MLANYHTIVSIHTPVQYFEPHTFQYNVLTLKIRKCNIITTLCYDHAKSHQYIDCQ
jgi:hypothetical protein